MLNFQAPETIVPDARGIWRPSDSHADMWSLGQLLLALRSRRIRSALILSGMILHKLLFLRLPYGDTEDFDKLQNAIREYPGYVVVPRDA